MKIARFPRLRISRASTPLERMPRRTELPGGPTPSIERDACTGLACGGNTTRKLEYLMTEAVQQGADRNALLDRLLGAHVRTVATSARATASRPTT